MSVSYGKATELYFGERIEMDRLYERERTRERIRAHSGKLPVFDYTLNQWLEPPEEDVVLTTTSDHTEPVRWIRNNSGEVVGARSDVLTTERLDELMNQFRMPQPEPAKPVNAPKPVQPIPTGRKIVL